MALFEFRKVQVWDLEERDLASHVCSLDRFDPIYSIKIHMRQVNRLAEIAPLMIYIA